MPNAVTVSFEFFPPSDDAMAGHLWAAIAAIGPVTAQIRLGNLRRRWLDALQNA